MSKFWRYAIGGVPLIIYDHIKTSSDGENHASSSISETEVDHINNLIEKAKLQGLTEITIDISKNLHDELSLGGNIPTPSGVNVDMKLKSDVSGDGKFQLRVTFPPPDETIERLAQLKKLHVSGAITDEEFTNAKARVIQSM
ncbi:SHOCT domain-containing protein [Vibrio parahaemolyticus]|uniref:SHOCT domain-containing protein n=1 Tax=Vibrio parahaemolyticus TaxID=670 RepID=UPI001EEBAEEE|nr:SHOCT domain-containing protein [Vibrio parahaemolyticus]MCG6467337.1 SHOCT domain-containing protein [Vibrio parahaemolyticus]MCG6490083.1 SHOCT domain-containing protein [Vibrio parahaemolyticus]